MDIAYADHDALNSFNTGAVQPIFPFKILLFAYLAPADKGCNLHPYSLLYMNTYLKYQPPVVQFLAFMMLAGGFFIVDYFASAMLFSDINAVMLNPGATITPDIILKSKIAQVTASILMFIVPALLFGYYSSEKPMRYIGMHRRLSIWLFLAAIALLFFIQPFADWLGRINAGIHFGSAHEMLKEKEAIYNRIMKSFLQMHSPSDLVLNLFIMALLPAVGEELFFRGALQTVLLRMNNKPWLSILISSFVFALLHLTIFKVLPIFVLGAVLGTVFYITRNIWYTIVIHFLNNAFAVLGVYYASSNSFMKRLADDSLQLPAYTALISLAASVFLLYYMHNKSEKEGLNQTIEEDIA